MTQATIHQRLKKHFAADPATLPVVANEFASYERPNLQLAITGTLEAEDCSSDLIGIVEYDYDTKLSRLALRGTKNDFHEGPVEYVDTALPEGEKLACVKQGLYLITTDDKPVAMLVAEKDQYFCKITVEVMAAERDTAEAFLRNLVSATNKSKAFRGSVLSLDVDCYQQTTIEFHQLPKIACGDLILPEEIRSRIERHTNDFSRHAERLKRAGRHLKRGILLHGPPGTGKTLTAMYLAAQMPDRTVLLMTGRGMGSIETACKLARLLQPTTVVLEDVDLIGTQRHMQAVDANALLFELLNQMDGLADDCDILFILTTNRPDILEPALAARPGRVDQAIEVPLPDAECRRRLFDLYGRGLNVDVKDWDALVERTEGVSAAFIRELLRKATVLAALESDADDLVVRQSHIEHGLEELLIAGGDLTKSLLGASTG